METNTQITITKTGRQWAVLQGGVALYAATTKGEAQQQVQIARALCGFFHDAARPHYTELDDMIQARLWEQEYLQRQLATALKDMQTLCARDLAQAAHPARWMSDPGRYARSGVEVDVALQALRAAQEEMHRLTMLAYRTAPTSEGGKAAILTCLFAALANLKAVA